MVIFNTDIIENTVNILIEGGNYRTAVVYEINNCFMNFAIDFFKKIVMAKVNSDEINLNWYKNNFIDNDELSKDECAICAGINCKTIENIYGSQKREVVVDVAKANFEYLSELINKLEIEKNEKLIVSIKLSYKNIDVNLSLAESLLVINALATKRIAITGGAWSSIGKNVEKPLVDRLCELCNVPKENIDNSTFKKDKNKKFDREVDYKLIDKNGKTKRVEVKLMGKGNPESADAGIARGAQIFIADTLSKQNKNQLSSLGIKYLELKDNKNVIKDFKNILYELNIPYSD